MKTFLTVVAAVVVGLIAVVALGWWWLKRKLSGLGRLFAELAGAAPPPFRITLEAAHGELPWSDPAAVAAAGAALEAAGYEPAGDYTIPEMDDIRVRGFAHLGLDLFAAVYDHPAAGLVTDIVCQLEDGWSVTVSNAPETGLDRPPSHPMIRLPRTATADDVHDRMTREGPNRPRIVTTPGLFAERFEASYREEMDWRISRRGPTEAEIRRVAEIAGEDRPDEKAVSVIRDMWSSAIDDFVFTKALDGYLAQTSMSAVEWEERRDSIVVVHEYSDPAERIDELSWGVAGCDLSGDDEAGGVIPERAFERASERIGRLFEGRPVREAFVAAQDLLPDDRRYELVGSVTEPWAADLYLAPEDA